MAEYISANLGTIAVAAVVFGAVAAIIAKMVRDKKRGINPACGCSCDSCGGGCKQK